MGVIKKKTITKGTEGGLKYICDVCAIDITATVGTPHRVLPLTPSSPTSAIPRLSNDITPASQPRVSGVVDCTAAADISSQVRIQCAEKDLCPDYDLCVPCFGQGASSKTHVPAQHRYHVIEQHSIPVYDGDWGADEELLLLEGAETYGLGSWADIADHIGGFRSKDEARDHYIDIYVNSRNFPLPARADPRDMSLLDEIPREDFQARKKRRIEERKQAAKDAPPAPPKQKPTASVPACHEVQGYMPGRLEFETEFNNEAEEAVQHMQFEPGDGINPRTGELEPEMELKMAVMDIYNSKLTARAMRKRAIFEHKLLEYRKNAGLDKRRTKEERDLMQKVKPFAKITNHDDWSAFAQGLVDEHYQRMAISQLQEWRAKGIRDLRTGSEYEKEKANRLARPAAVGVFDRLPGSRPPKPAPPMEIPPNMAALTAPELPSDMTTKQKPESARKAEERRAKDQALVNGNGNANKDKDKDVKREERVPYSPASVQGVAPLKLGPDTADLQLLPKEERELCSVLRMTPKAYIACKDGIFKEAVKNGGFMKRKTVKELCKVSLSRPPFYFRFGGGCDERSC